MTANEENAVSAKLEARKHQVDQQRVLYLYTHAPKVVPVNVVATLLFLSLCWDLISHEVLLTWVGAMAIAMVVRLIHVKAVIKNKSWSSDPLSQENLFLIGATLNGLLWGIGFIYVASPASEALQYFYSVILGGFSAGAFTSMATSHKVYRAYVASLIVLPTIYLLLDGNFVAIVLAVLMAMFMTVQIITHTMSSIMLIDGIYLKFEKEDLINELSDSNDELQTINQQLQSAKEELRVISLTDELTGLANRRYFTQMLDKEWQRLARDNQTIACLMIDIDHFKWYNDYYGHQQGDQCLYQVAQQLKLAIQRPSDIVARYGGEEFIAILPATELSGAILVAERMIHGLKQINLEHKESQIGRVTVSIGVAHAETPKHNNPDAILKLADDALYRAKNNGRNQIAIADNH